MFKQITKILPLLFSKPLTVLLISVSIVSFLSMIFFLPARQVNATSNATINFQARLLTSSGALVSDGNYNVEFKIYSGCTNEPTNNTGCTNDWTEDWYNVNSSEGIRVSDGYLTANLGSYCPLNDTSTCQGHTESTIPWGSPLWLSINIGGTTTGTPTLDGEMNPYLSMTSVPAAMSLTGTNGTYTSTLAFQSPNASQSILLPNDTSGATEYVCYQGDTTGCGFAPTSGSGNYIQNAYTATQSANFNIQGSSGTAAVSVIEANNGGSGDVLDLKNGSGALVASFGNTGRALLQTTTNSSTAYQIQNSDGESILQVGTTLTTNYIADGDFANGSGSCPLTDWSVTGSPTSCAQNTTATDTYEGSTSLKLVTTTTSGQGVSTSSFTSSPTTAASGTGEYYTVSFEAMQTGGATLLTGNNLEAVASGGGNPFSNCTINGSAGNALSSSGFEQVVCTLTFTASGSISALSIEDTGTISTADTLYIDDVQLQSATSSSGTLSAYQEGTLDLRGVINNPIALQNVSNSTTALQVENVSGYDEFNIDSVNNQAVLGTAGHLTGQLTFENAGNAYGVSIASSSSQANTLALTIPSDTNSTDNICLQTLQNCNNAGTNDYYLVQQPISSTAGQVGADVISPGTANVVGLTVNGTTGTSAAAAIFNQANNTSPGDTVQVNTTSTGNQTNGILYSHNGTGGTTTNGINITNTAGTLSEGLTLNAATAIGNGIDFTGAGGFTNLISATNFSVSNAGVITLQGNQSPADITSNVTANNSTFTVKPGSFATNSDNGATLVLQGGNEGGTTSTGGSVSIDAGTGTTNGNVYVGTSSSAANAKTIYIGSNASAVSQTIDVGYNATASSSDNVNIGSLLGGSTTTIQGGTTGTTISVQAGSGGSVAIGTANANTVTVGSTTNANTVADIYGGATGGVSVQTGSTGTINVGTTAQAESVNIGDTSTANSGNTQTIDLGYLSGTGTTNVNIGSTTGASAGTTTVSGVTKVAIISGSTSDTVQSSGETLQTTANSSTAYQIQNSDGESILQAGTSSSTNYITDADFANGSGTTLNDWTKVGGTFTQNTTAADTFEGATSVQDVLSAANQGFETPGTGAGLTSLPTTNNGVDEYYTVSFEAIQTAGTALAASTFTVTGVDASGNKTCTGTIGGLGTTTLSANGFEQVYCTLQFTSGTAGTITQIEVQTSGTSGTIYFDDVQLQLATSASVNAVPSAYQEGNLSLRGIITNPVSLQNVSNSTSALQVQNAAGSDLVDVDTLDGTVNLGTAINTNINIGTTTTSDLITIGGASTTGSLLIQGEGLTDTITGAASNPTDIVKGSSTGAFQVSNATGDVLNVNTSTNIVTVSAASADTASFVLNNPSGTAGIEFRSGASTSYSTFIGVNSGANNTFSGTSGFQNTSVGNGALQGNTTGSYNTGLGVYALNANQLGSYDTAIGNGSLQVLGTGATTEDYNTAVGNNTLSADEAGGSNTAIGSYSLYYNNSNYNTAVGAWALTSADNGSTAEYDTALGYYAGAQDSTDGFYTPGSIQNATALGYEAQVQANDSLVLGGEGANAVNVGIGTTVPLNTLSVSPLYYGTGDGTAYDASGNTSVTGIGTTWTSAMIGMQFIFANGEEGIITAVGSTTSITLNASVAAITLANAEDYHIQDIGFQVTSSGNSYEQNTSTTAFQVQNTAGFNVLDADTSNNQVVFGSSSHNNGELEFLNSNNSDTIQLQAPNTTTGTGNQSSSYSLVLPTSSPSKGLCLETSTTNASQLVFSACANSNASISEVAQQSFYTGGSSTTSASYTPTNVGDLLVLSTLIPNNSSTGVTSISNGSCVGGWTKVITSPSANSFNRVEMWMGTASATSGCSAFTVTYSGGSGNSNEINISEYTAVGVNGGTTWGVDTDGVNNSGATNSGTITWDTLASQDSSELYVGYGQSVSGTGTSGGCAAGFNCAATTDHNVLTYDPSVTANVNNTPTATQTTSAEYNTVSAIFIVNVSSTAINNQLSVQEANYNVQSGGSGEVAGVLQANSSQNADIMDFYNGSGLQGTSTEVLSVLGGSTNAGNIQFGGLTNQAITVTTQATTNANGNTLQVAGQQGNGTGNGGVIQIVGGAGGTTSGTGGQVTIQGGSATAGVSNGGNVLIQGGAKSSTGTGGSVIIQPLSDSTQAFEVQNQANSYNELSVDTSNNQVVLGTSSHLGGQLEFLNSTNSDTVTLEAPNNAGLPNGGSNTQAASYSLVLPYNAPSPGLCLETSNTDQNQLTFSACDNSNASISLVTTSDDTTSTSSIAGTTYAPASAGNLVVVSFLLPTAYTGSVSGITDSNVSGGFTKVSASPESASNYGRVEVWMGTASGTSTSNNMSFTYSGGSPGAGYEIQVSEYTAVGVNAGTTWGVDTSGISSSSSAVGTITFPNLTTSDAGELYFGAAVSASGDGQSNTGCTTNFTCTATTDHNLIAYDTASGANVSYTPLSTQSANSKYNTVGAAFIAYVSSTAINNQVSVQQANYNVQSGGSGEVAGVLQANSSQNADIMDFYNGSAAQSTSTEVLSVLGGSTTAGDIQFGGLTSETIAVTAQTTANTAGASLTVSSANGNGTGAGGQLKLAAGNSGAGATGTGGEVLIQGGNASSTNGNGGNVLLQGGVKAGTGSTGSVIVQPETNDVTTAFEVQNAAGSNTILDVDTTLGGTYSNSGVIINSGVAGVSGLKFAQLNSTSSFTTNFTDILGLDANGNVGVSSVAVSLTSPALAYWDGTADPTGTNNSYPQATVQSLGTTSYTPNFTTANGEQLTDTNTAGNETGDINWNFAQVPFEEIQFQFKSGGGNGADGVWFYGYTDSIPHTEFGCTAFTGSTCTSTISYGYIIYFSEYHHCIGISYGAFTDGNQCNNGGGTSTGTGTSPLKSVSAPNLNDNNFHNVDIQIDYNVITVRYDGAVVLTEVDSVGRDTSHLNFGFGARTGGSYDNHYIKGLLVTKLGTGTSQYGIDQDNALANTTLDTSTSATGYGSLYWNNADGYLGVGAAAAASTLEVDGTFSDQNIVQAYNYNDTACEASGGTTQCNTSQAGSGIYSATTTVTAEGSSSFSSSWVGDKITWANGDSGTITAVGSTTSMTVSTSALEGTQQYQITNPAAFNISSSGQVGIGTGSPSFNLDVQGNAAGAYMERIYNQNTTAGGTVAAGSDGLLIQLGTANASRTTGNQFIAFAGGTTGSGTVLGAIQGAASAVVYSTNAADYAEYFKANPSNLPQPGDIVSLDPYNSQGVVDSDGGAAVGVVSTQPGFVGNGPVCASGDDTCENDFQENNVIVGMTGQVPTIVSVANGAINVGDPIMASPTQPGVGEKATGLAQIVGYAEQATTTDGTIMVLIQPGIYNPITADNVQGGGTPLTLNSDLEVTGNTTLDGNLSVAKDITAGTVTATTANVTGNLTVIGSTSTGNLTVSGNTTLQTLVVGGQASFGGDIRLTGKVNTRQATIKTFTASKAITAGSVVVLDATTGNEGDVTTTTMESDPKVIGVAVTSSTQAGESIDVAIGGWIQVNVDTTPDGNGNPPPPLTPGELLVTSANAGTVEASTNPTAGSILGKTTDSQDSNNQVWILITLQ